MRSSTKDVQSESNRSVSVVVTVKDEEQTISELLNSLTRQTFNPQEIIIVDGGSTDDTPKILQEWSKKTPGIRIFLEEGLNIAQGRNLGIRKAVHDIVVVTDAGSVPKDDWIEKITQPIFDDRSVDVVGGWFEVDAGSRFEKVVGVLNVPEPRDLDPEQFLPSGRSVAMKVEAWRKVGGYPEWLHRCGEDTVFGLLLRRNHIPIVFQPEALVYWRPMQSLNELFRQYLCYARGDAEAGLFLKRFLKIGIVYGLTGSFLVLGFVYHPQFLFYSGTLLLIHILRHLFRIRTHFESWVDYLVLFPVKVVMDLGLLLGHVDGYRRRVLCFVRVLLGNQ